MKSLKSNKFIELTSEQKEKTVGGLAWTFWIGDTNGSTEDACGDKTIGSTDLNTGWFKDSTTNSDDTIDCDFG